MYMQAPKEVETTEEQITTTQLKQIEHETTHAAQCSDLNGSVNGISNKWSQACENATGYNPQAMGYSMRVTSPSDSYLTSLGASSAIQGNSITIGNTKDVAHELGHIPDRAEGKVKADTTIAGQPVCTDTQLEARADSYGDKIQSEYNKLG